MGRGGDQFPTLVSNIYTSSRQHFGIGLHILRWLRNSQASAHGYHNNNPKDLDLFSGYGTANGDLSRHDHDYYTSISGFCWLSNNFFVSNSSWIDNTLFPTVT